MNLTFEQTAFLNAPANLQLLSLEYGSVRIGWDNTNSDDPTVTYAVLRALVGSGDFQEIEQEVEQDLECVADSPENSCEYEDNTVLEGETYDYGVIAQDIECDNTGVCQELHSDMEILEGVGPIPSSPTPNAPADLTTLGVTWAGVHLGWTDTNAGSADYVILRSLSGQGAFVEIGMTFASDCSGDCQFEDVNVFAGETYDYAVRAQIGSQYSTDSFLNNVGPIPEEPSEEPSITGYVLVGGEEVIGYPVELRDSATGSLVAATETDAGSFFNFVGIDAGIYDIVLLSPDNQILSTVEDIEVIGHVFVEISV